MGEFVEELIQDFTSMALAGTDSTAATAMMMIYYCVKNPRVLEKL